MLSDPLISAAVTELIDFFEDEHAITRFTRHANGNAFESTN